MVPQNPSSLVLSPLSPSSSPFVIPLRHPLPSTIGQSTIVVALAALVLPAPLYRFPSPDPLPPQCQLAGPPKLAVPSIPRDFEWSIPALSLSPSFTQSHPALVPLLLFVYIV
ncbi:hypothetical protein FB45DRAFT_1046696 [Roridomyces roridus]|uniref:Uncharacterized protein n=1 Tax=Roridomyces roridus TaxID=1738132 RepID=A0AAD7AX44_9AGAR|nr:hypothetical protein FB45DRAFT_1046696 [Roridomyces roridus]